MDDSNELERLRRIEHSTIWRATRPLRQVGTRFPFISRQGRRVLNLAWWAVTLQLPARYSAWREHRSDRAFPRLRRVNARDLVLPVSPEPLVSVIIPTYGQMLATLNCLDSIRHNPPRYPIEILVIDDAYPGPEDISVLDEVRGIRVVRNATNLGFIGSTNYGASLARGKYLHFLNNDTKLYPSAIDALVETLEQVPNAGMAGSKLHFPDGTLQEAGGIIWQDGSGWNYGRGDRPDKPEYNYLREVDYCSGASLMVPKRLFDELGGFDTEFAPAYYEDTDLAFRIRSSGLRVLYQPRSALIHYEGMSNGTDLTSGVKRHQVTNRTKFIQRWRQTLQTEHGRSGEHVMRARDRAKARKLILVIDHYTPEPDRDAGSRNTLGMLESLLASGWVVKMWPDNRFYSQKYTPSLEAMGIEVIDERWPGDFSRWVAHNGLELDHVMAMRPYIAAKYLGDLGGLSAVLSFYGHDIHASRMLQEAETLGSPDVLAAAQRMELLEKRLWRYFDLSMYPSETEAATVREKSPGTLARSIVPFSVDTLHPRTSPTSSRSILFVAGFAHSPNVDAATLLVRDVLPQVQAIAGDDIQVVLAGSNPSDAVRALASASVRVTGYVSDAELNELYDTCRVACVPLRFGAGIKGKVVEALGHGLPLVTTPVGAQGIPGLEEVSQVASDSSGIASAIVRLLTDDAFWMRQSKAQVAFARERFSKASMRASLISALEAAEEEIARRTLPAGGRGRAPQ